LQQVAQGTSGTFETGSQRLGYGHVSWARLLFFGGASTPEKASTLWAPSYNIVAIPLAARVRRRRADVGQHGHRRGQRTAPAPV